MNSDILTQLSGAEIARRIRDKDLSPVEVVEGYLERIDRYDGVLHSYITVCRDEALAAARKAEQAVLQGESLGPLHGLPLSVKDQMDTAGVLTTAGSTILGDYVPTEDATLIARAKAAGAVLLGKLNMTEFAAGQGDPFKYGDPVRNPWDLERFPAAPAAVQASPWRPRCARSRWARTRAARSEGRRPSAASSAFVPPGGCSAGTGCGPSPGRWTRWGR